MKSVQPPGARVGPKVLPRRDEPDPQHVMKDARALLTHVRTRVAEAEAFFQARNIDLKATVAAMLGRQSPEFQQEMRRVLAEDREALQKEVAAECLRLQALRLPTRVGRRPRPPLI